MKCKILTNGFGDRFYYANNKLHREDGPAIEWANGDKSWYKNGDPHRVDGPSIEHNNGAKRWWLNGIFYGFDSDFSIKSWKIFVKTLIFSQYIIMKYDIETDRFGTKHYYINNVLHREDGPAVEYSNGSKCFIS